MSGEQGLFNMNEFSDEDIQLTRKIILEIINKRTSVDSIELNKAAQNVLSIINSLGGNRDEKTIRLVSESKLEEWFGV